MSDGRDTTKALHELHLAIFTVITRVPSSPRSMYRTPGIKINVSKRLVAVCELVAR
jgi:hypothetical protein